MGNALIGRYDSLDAYMAAVMQPVKNKANASESDKFTKGHRDADWYGMEQVDGGTDIGNLNSMVHNGWERGVNKMLPLLGNMEVPPVMSVKRRRVRGDRGDQIDMGRVYAGELDTAWSRVARRSVVSPYRVIIVLDTIASACVDADAMFWRNAAAVALSDHLSAAGYAVKVIAAFEGQSILNGRGQSARVSMQVIIKEYNQPWDLNNAAMVAMPGFFRGIGHLWYYNNGKDSLSSSGMRVNDVTKVDIEDHDAPHVFIPPRSVSNMQGAEAWIKSTVDELNNTKKE